MKRVFVTLAALVIVVGCAQPNDSRLGSSLIAPSSMARIVPGPLPPEPLQGRFTGGGFQIDAAGVKVTRGFTIHCDRLLSNNLEINWEGNQFHMEEHTLTVSCREDAGLQPPPAAPVDTIDGVGTGRYNGVDGATIAFTLVDAGEPGTGGAPGTNDMAALLITNASGAVVLNVPLSDIDGGNIQAHFDQPHK